jgi:hypothetical protein
LKKRQGETREKSSLVSGANMRISSETIESILQQEDIEGLLNLGAPRDEYSFEAKEIAAELHAVNEQLKKTYPAL